MGDRHDGFLGTAVPEHPSESRLQRAVLDPTRPAAASMSAGRSQRLPFRILPDLCFPALSWLPGQRAAQLARWPALGNALMSTPISAMMTSAVR